MWCICVCSQVSRDLFALLRFDEFIIAWPSYNTLFFINDTVPSTYICRPLKRVIRRFSEFNSLILCSIFVTVAMYVISCYINSSGPGRFECHFRQVVFNVEIDYWLIYLQWNCLWMDVAGPYWWQVNIGSKNDLLPSGNKPLPWACVDPDSCHHMASLDHNELDHFISRPFILIAH